MSFKTTTTNPGTGGANLATDLFTDSDAQQRTMPYSALAVGDIGGPYAPVDNTHPLPVQIENASVAVTSVAQDAAFIAPSSTVEPAVALVVMGKSNDGTPSYRPLPLTTTGRGVVVEGLANATPVPVSATSLPLPAGAAADGTDGTGIALPTGGTGIRGWLSGIYQAITGLLRIKLYDAGGANAADVSAAGALRVDGSAVTQPVSGTVLVSNSGFAASQSGTWTVAVSSVAGTVAATQSGAWTVSTTGTTTVTGTVTANQGGAPWSTNATQIGGAAVSTAEGASDAGTTRVSLGTDGGTLTFSKLSTADTNLNTIKSSTGTLFRLEAFNTGAAVAYLRIYDKSSNPVPASDTPKRRYTIPAGTTGAGFVVEYLKGRPFANGIAYDITGGVADSDTTAIAAGQVVLNCDYK